MTLNLAIIPAIYALCYFYHTKHANTVMTIFKAEVSTSAVAVEAECDTSSGMLLLFKLSPDTKYTREESRDLTAKDLVFGHNCLYGGFITEKGVQWMRFVDTGKRIAVTECTEKNKRDLNLDLDKFLNSRTDEAES